MLSLLVELKCGRWYVTSDLDPVQRRVWANPEQIHQALCVNGWKRMGDALSVEGLAGVWVHSRNYPLGQSATPLERYLEVPGGV